MMQYPMATADLARPVRHVLLTAAFVIRAPQCVLPTACVRFES
jgi:hypothetical protein